MHYINFYFKNLKHNIETNIITGHFESPGLDVFCEFTYNLENKEYVISNNNKPIDEILPLPFYWLEIKLKRNGKLNINESKISY